MGIFLAIEGPKGAGKTTLASALRQRIMEAGEGGIILTKEPTPAFDLGQEEQLTGISLAQAIAHDRAAHVAEVISPALRAGYSVACDRYILSSLIFHTSDGVPPDEVWRLNESFPLPDVNLVLSVPAPVIMSRRGVRSYLTRLEEASDPAAELDNYVHFGREMESSGVPLKILSNETPGQLSRALEWIMDSIRNGVAP